MSLDQLEPKAQGASSVSPRKGRLDPTPRTQIAVWAAAAGRCTFCNRLVTENEDLGEVVDIGELAHIVGWGSNSPRGDSQLTDEERRQAENLVLLCRTCHKPVDANGVVGRYTVEQLRKLKQDHEGRIRFLTEIGADRKATIIRLAGPIRGAIPELTYDTVLTATTAAGLFPELLPGSFGAEFDLDLRGLRESSDERYFTESCFQIDTLMDRVNDGIRRSAITRLAIFAFARIPLLIYLGARLDDKVATHVFQRHRTDTENAWRWPDNGAIAPTFTFSQIATGSDPHKIALIVNLSGMISLQELPAEIDAHWTVYTVTPAEGHEIGPGILSSPQALANFERVMRAFLVKVECDHGKPQQVALFPAAPLAAAITLGRVLMPDVSPAWLVFDRDQQNRFFRALEVKR